MADTELLQNMFTEMPKAKNFTDSQWIQLTDYNNGSYTTQIQFDTDSLKDDFVSFHDAFVSIPFQVKPTSGNYTSASLVAMKASLLSLIYGVQVINASNSGGTLVNDVGVQFINNLRLCIEKSSDWGNSEACEIQFAKDMNDTRDPNATLLQYSTTATSGITYTFDESKTTFTSTCASTATGTGSLVLSAGSGISMLNPLQSGIGNGINNDYYNEGFAKRVMFLQNQSTIVGGAIQCTACIPLALLHDFFNQLDFPIYNMRWKIILMLASGSVYPPIMVGNGTRQGITTVTGPCTLYYRKLQLPAEALSNLKNVKQKQIDFISTDFVTPAYNNSVTTGLQLPISSSTIMPLRLWSLLYPAGTITAQADADPSTTSSGYCSPLCATGQLTNANVSINNKPYFEYNYNKSYEFWQALKEQFPGFGQGDTLGSMLNYNDFLSNFRYHVFDISRLKGDRLKAPNNAVTIQLNCARSDSNGAMDYIVLVERLSSLVLDFEKSAVRSIYGTTA